MTSGCVILKVCESKVEFELLHRRHICLQQRVHVNSLVAVLVTFDLVLLTLQLVSVLVLTVVNN